MKENLELHMGRLQAHLPVLADEVDEPSVHNKVSIRRLGEDVILQYMTQEINVSVGSSSHKIRRFSYRSLGLLSVIVQAVMTKNITEWSSVPFV